MKQSLPSREAVQQFYLTSLIVRELQDHKKMVERAMFIVGLVSASMSIPQIIIIYNAKDSSQISLMAWSYYALVNILWILYASVFKRPVLKRVQILYFVSNVLVIGITLYYRWFI